MVFVKMFQSLVMLAAASAREDTDVMLQVTKIAMTDGPALAQTGSEALQEDAQEEVEDQVRSLGSGSQIFENGGKCLKGDFKTFKAMGTGAHTIRATVTMPSDISTAKARQWILNLGQNGAGANHWLWSPTNVHKHGDLQFGRWNGGQIKGVSKGVTHDQMMNAASLTTTFDGKTYSFYIDGNLKKTTVIIPPLNIKNKILRVGLQPPGWQANKKEVDFSGCVTKVEVWDSALTSDEVARQPQRNSKKGKRRALRRRRTKKLLEIPNVEEKPLEIPNVDKKP